MKHKKRMKFNKIWNKYLCPIVKYIILLAGIIAFILIVGHLEYLTSYEYYFSNGG